MKKRLLCVFLFTTAMLLAACGSSKDSAKTSSKETDEKPALEENGSESSIEETVLYEQDNIKIIASKLTETPASDWKLDLTIENKSDKDISVGITELKANDILVDGCELNNALNPAGEPDLNSMSELGFQIIEIASGDTQTAEDITYSLSKSRLDAENIATLEKINITLGIFDTDTKELLSQTVSTEILIQ